RGALVLAELRVDLARDRQVREVRGERGLERPLVRRVCVAVEEAHRDALDVPPFERLDDGGELVEREWEENGAVGAHALADLQPEPPLDQGLGLRRQPEIVEVEPALPRDEIGKGSADVDADATSHIAPLTAHHPSTVTRVPASAPFGPLDRAMPHAVSWSGPGRWLCAPIACSGRSTSTRRGSVCGS